MGTDLAVSLIETVELLPVAKDCARKEAQPADPHTIASRDEKSSRDVSPLPTGLNVRAAILTGGSAFSEAVQRGNQRPAGAHDAGGLLIKRRGAMSLLTRIALGLVLVGCATTTPVRDTHTLATTQRSDFSRTTAQSDGGDLLDRTVQVDPNTGTVYVHTVLATSQPSSSVTVTGSSEHETITDTGHIGASLSGWMPDSVTMEGFAEKKLGSEWRTKVPVAIAVMILGALVFYLGDRLEGFVLFGVGIAIACLPGWMVGVGIAIAVLCFAWPYLKKSELVTSITAGIERAKLKIEQNFPSVAADVTQTLTGQLEAEQTRPQSDKIDKVRQSKAVKAAVAVVVAQGAKA